MTFETSQLITIAIAVIASLWAVASTGFLLVQRRQDDKDAVQDKNVKAIKEEMDKREQETKRALKETKEQIKDNQRGIGSQLDAITKMLTELKVQMGETYQKHIRIEKTAGKNEVDIKELDQKYQKLGQEVTLMEAELNSIKEEIRINKQ